MIWREAPRGLGCEVRLATEQETGLFARPAIAARSKPRPLTPQLIADIIDESILLELSQPSLTRKQAFDQACYKFGMPTLQYLEDV